MGKLSPEAESLLAATRTADDPTPEDEVRVHRALLAAIAAPAIGATASSTAAAAATGGAVAGGGVAAGGGAIGGGSAAIGGGSAAIGGSAALGGSMAMKALVVAVVAATVAGGGYVAVQSATEPETRTVERAVAAESTLDERRGTTEARSASSSGVRETGVRETEVRESEVREPERDVVEDVPPADDLGATIDIEASTDRRAGADGSRRDRAAARHQQAGHRRVRTAPSSLGVTLEDAHDVEVAAPSERLRDSLREEIELLAAADGALRSGDGARALELTEVHRTRFPRGQLARDRDVVQVLALCAVGRVNEARTRAAPLFAHYANTPAAQRLMSSCVQENDR
jgi:hypothetical protein